MYISGGENVYPAEVERVLNKHPAVLEAAVIGMRGREMGRSRPRLPHRPARARSSISPRSTRWCRERLAAYKVPKHFDVVADLPRTAAGKVRKHILKEQLHGRR